MKKINPEDLSLNIRNVDNSNIEYPKNVKDRIIVETKDGCNTREDCFTRNKCYTQDECDTLDDCVTNIYCDTDGACKTATCNCGNTTKCPTAACGDTRTKAVICCAMTDGPDCVVNTRTCAQTNPCLVSKDIACNETIKECLISKECEDSEVCPATLFGQIC